MYKFRNQRGQLILILILVMAVGLAIGLSVIQKSLINVSTSTKVEQSSKAFSAAEAGIENVLTGGNSTVNFSDTGASAIVIGDSTWIPAPVSSGQQSVLEFPPLSKEEVAQVWLADPEANLPDCAGFTCYKRPVLDIYWGAPTSTDIAALELTLVYYDEDSYKYRKWYLDQNITRSPENRFTKVNCSGGYFANKYKCTFRIGGPADLAGLLPPGLMLIRARLLYNTSPQPFAVQPPSSETCGEDCSLPRQAKSIISTGISGETQRKVKLFQVKKVVPFYFDYAIFSAGDIKK